MLSAKKNSGSNSTISPQYWRRLISLGLGGKITSVKIGLNSVSEVTVSVIVFSFESIPSQPSNL